MSPFLTGLKTEITMWQSRETFWLTQMRLYPPESPDWDNNFRMFSMAQANREHCEKIFALENPTHQERHASCTL